MRAIAIAVVVLVSSGPILAQQKIPPVPVQRTFIPDEPLPCVAFNRMAARLDAVYRIEEISKADYEQGTKKNTDSIEGDGVNYFAAGNDKYQKISFLPGKRAEFIRWYAVEGGRGQFVTANTQCATEMREREERYAGIYALRQLQDEMTVSQAEGLLADAALEGQTIVIKALLESESARTNVVDRYNKLVQSVNSYNKAVNDLVMTVNTAMREPKGSKLAPELNFNFVRLQPVSCTASPFAFTNSMTYMANVEAAAGADLTMHCE